MALSLSRSPLIWRPALLLFGAAVVASAAPSAQAARHGAARTDRLSLHITTTGSSVWGKVSARYTHAHRTVQLTCANAACQYTVPQGATVHLTQTATDTSTWPFSQWRVQAGTKKITSSKSSMTVHVTGALSVTAVYVLQQSQSSYPPPATNPYP